MKTVKVGVRRTGVKFFEKGRNWGFPSLMYDADDLVWTSGSDDRMFSWRMQRKGLEMNVHKRKVMMLGREEGSIGMRGNLNMFHLRIWYRWNVVGEWRTGGKLSVRSHLLWMIGSFRLESAKVRHEGLLVSGLMYTKEIVVWEGKKDLGLRLNRWITWGAC